MGRIRLRGIKGTLYLVEKQLARFYNIAVVQCVIIGALRFVRNLIYTQGREYSLIF